MNQQFISTMNKDNWKKNPIAQLLDFCPYEKQTHTYTDTHTHTNLKIHYFWKIYCYFIESVFQLHEVPNIILPYTHYLPNK